MRLGARRGAAFGSCRGASRGRLRLTSGARFTKHAAEISATDLKASVGNMKKWNARRKLKGGIKAVMAANRAGHAIDALKH